MEFEDAIHPIMCNQRVRRESWKKGDRLCVRKDKDGKKRIYLREDAQGTKFVMTVYDFTQDDIFYANDWEVIRQPPAKVKTSKT